MYIQPLVRGRKLLRNERVGGGEGGWGWGRAIVLACRTDGRSDGRTIGRPGGRVANRTDDRQPGCRLPPARLAVAARPVAACRPPGDQPTLNPVCRKHTVGKPRFRGFPRVVSGNTQPDFGCLIKQEEPHEFLISKKCACETQGWVWVGF